MSYLGRSAKLSLKAQEKVSFLATAGQTEKTGLSYTPTFVEVYVNGVLLTDTTDFTATNGNSITFTVALLVNDEVTVVSLKTFTVADHYSKTEADTLLAAKATVANFTSTGIDDNATSTAITIDASEIVTVGSTVSPALKVNRQSANGDAYIELQSNGTKVANLVGSSVGGFSVHTGASGTLTTALSIDNSGNVGIGVVPETDWTSSFDVIQYGQAGVLWANNNDNSARLGMNVKYDGAYKYINTNKAVNLTLDSVGQFVFDVAPSGSADSAISWTTAMDITNNGIINIGVGHASNHSRLNISSPSDLWAMRLDSGSGSGYAVKFYHETTNVTCGSIRTTASSTSYNQNSDYRLKTDVQPMTGAADRVKLLKPCNFEWIADGTRVDGFLAHEAQEVVPESVVGTKDAMMDEEYEVTPAVLDDEGVETTAAVMGTRSVPDMQGIDQAKLVPLLTATIQELIARIEALES